MSPTFIELESSQIDSSPIELYVFIQEVTSKVWAWTTGDFDLIAYGTYYTQEPIVRSEINISGDNSDDLITLEVSPTNEIANLFLAGVPEHPIQLQIYRVQRNHFTGSDHTVTNEARVYEGYPSLTWTGRVRAVQWNTDSATITADLWRTTGARQAPRLLYSRQCNHMLFDGGCRLTKEAFKLTGPVTLVEGLDVHMLVAGTVESGYLRHGMLVRNEKEYRTIDRHVSNKLTINIPFIGLEAGDVLDVFWGCDRSRLSCEYKFDNIINFGGFPYIPQINPFTAKISKV